MKILPLSLLLLLPFSFSACNFDSLNNSFTYPSYSGLSFSGSDDTWAYSASNDIHVLSENSATLSISGNLGGKTLYVADVNTSNIKIDKEYVKTAKIGRAVADADVFISLSHFKGHEAAGFGGAIKNVGMGCGSRGRKNGTA